ncbi:MAG: transglycosylase domain-containing protein [Alcaligenaceae bacterium]
MNSQRSLGRLISRLLCQAIVSLGLLTSHAFAEGLPSFAEVKAAHEPSDIRVLDRHGELIHRLRTNRDVRRGQWISLEAISPAFRQAIVLSEDKRFYEHSGVDWRAVSSAAWGNLWNQKTRGASTLTMQLVGLLDEDLKSKKAGRAFTKKIEQSVTAEWLELKWRKDQILEAYLNLVPFRGETVGIDALSQTLFGKAAQGLDDQEAAIAAALVRGPNAAPSEIARRACGVLRSIEANAPATVCDGLERSVDQALQRKAFEPSAGIAPQFARYSVAQWRQQLQTQHEAAQDLNTAVGSAEPLNTARARQRQSPVAEAPKTKSTSAPLGTTIKTTLDASLQRFSTQSLQVQLRELRKRHVEDGGVIVLNNKTGEILAWVGSSGTLSKAENVDTVLALRQPGSTLKPFLYAQAIAEQRLTAASLLDDSSAQLQTGAGLYIPQNYDRSFKGWVSARTALAASLNLPAVRTLMVVTPDAFAQQLKRIGLPLKQSGDYYGYSLALGSAEVSLLSLSNAYRTLANSGRYTPVTAPLSSGLVERSTDRARPNPHDGLTHQAQTQTQAVQALDPRAAFIVSDILSDPYARAGTFGTDSVLTTRFWSAVKTGTSKDMRDNWALGYSEHYTVGVWVGNANGTPMWDVSGTTGAAPVWAAVMSYLHREKSSAPPPSPFGVIQQAVELTNETGNHLEAPYREWFIQGTEQALFTLNRFDSPLESQLALQNQAKIATPTHGTILALDPDIPSSAQLVALKAEQFGAQHTLHWVINDKSLTGGNNTTWRPWPGQHEIALLDDSGVVLDRIKIEVRGAVASKDPSAVPKATK